MNPQRAFRLPCLLLAAATGLAANPQPELHSTHEILALHPEQSETGLAVQLQATVTYYKPGKAPDLMVADDSGEGLYVRLPPGVPAFTRGQRVDLHGHTERGPFAPIVNADRATLLGEGLAPQPQTINLADVSTLRDGRFVRLQGVVRSAEIDPHLDPPRLFLDLATPGGMARLWVLHFQPEDERRFVDADIAVAGVIQHLGTNRMEPGKLRLLVDRADDLSILEARPDAFGQPVTWLGQILSYSPQGPPTHRVHVTGTVTYHVDDLYFLQNEEAKVRVYTKQQADLSPGDRVDVVGFPVMGFSFGRLEDAIFRLDDHGPPPAPAGEPFQNPRATPVDYECHLVQITGVVRDRLRTENSQELLVETGGRVFIGALHGFDDAGPFGSARLGSLIRLTGILETEPQTRETLLGRGPADFRLLLRSPADLQILRQGPWWTPAKFIFTLCGAALLCLLGLGWAFSLGRRNRKLATEITARQNAESALQRMNDVLELRVEERSRQLAAEVQARRDAETAITATTRERNRLAAELHDSLEQALTGAAFQLQALNANLERPQTRVRHMELARKLLLRARQEARRSIWDLRSSLLEEMGLAAALRHTVDELLAGSEIVSDITISELPRRLPSLLEHHLLRLTQEAVANAVKHAAPTHIELALEQRDGSIHLLFRDNGRGFDPTSAKAAEGHFGVLGMRERVARLGGEFHLESQPGRGAEIRIRLPETAPEPLPEPTAV